MVRPDGASDRVDPALVLAPVAPGSHLDATPGRAMAAHGLKSWQQVIVCWHHHAGVAIALECSSRETDVQRHTDALSLGVEMSFADSGGNGESATGAVARERKGRRPSPRVVRVWSERADIPFVRTPDSGKVSGTFMDSINQQYRVRVRRSLDDGPWQEPVTFSIGMLPLSGHFARLDDENEEWHTGHFSIDTRRAMRLAALPAPVPWRGWADQQGAGVFPRRLHRDRRHVDPGQTAGQAGQRPAGAPRPTPRRRYRRYHSARLHGQRLPGRYLYRRQQEAVQPQRADRRRAGW